MRRGKEPLYKCLLLCNAKQRPKRLGVGERKGSRKEEEVTSRCILGGEMGWGEEYEESGKLRCFGWGGWGGMERNGVGWDGIGRDETV